MPFDSNFQMVQRFHEKFGLGALRPEYPRLIQDPVLEEFRQKFMQEELDEYKAAVAAGDLPKAFDALIDLVYVALGTADLMGCPFDDGFLMVQLANMKKERAKPGDPRSKRGTGFDVVKPEGWTPPNIERLLQVYIDRYNTAQRIESANQARGANTL